MKNRFVLSTLSAAHALAVKTLKEADRAFYRQRRIMEDSYSLPHGTFQGIETGEISEDFELRTSQLLAIWRDILSHYQSRPDIQQQLKNEFFRTIEREITPPP